jgi:DNA polymerase-3 subunit gamma/tau
MTDASAPATPYRVLARKYRPQRFADMIGQEALVRTLTNAIASGRIAQGYMLTGVRGVGKTTTARILARAFNCVGPDGKGGPTAEPCGVCAHCLAIAADRHMDVIEMDAASRTGVDDIRELIEGVRYAPVEARFKVYIIDEVHMLSEKAFNALLKTLEEPPAHVKFIFATTDIRKVPVTVLSRCQRFDLRRVDAEALAAYYARVAEGEGMRVAPAALALIARAADGSVRDGLSLLDRALALGDESDGKAEIGEDQIRDMLGLADRSHLFDLFDLLMRGETAGALTLFAELYRAGADPALLLQDLLDFTHWLTRIKLVPQAADDPAAAEIERRRGRELAGKLSVPVLTRCWQMLLKGLGEVQGAPSPLQAAEMALIRLTHAADMPPPGELAKRLLDASGPGAAAPAATGAAPSTKATGPAPRAAGAPLEERPRRQAQGAAASPATADPAPPLEAAPVAPAPSASIETATAQPVKLSPVNLNPESFVEVVALADAQGDLILRTNLVRHLHLVHFEPGRIELRPGPQAPTNLANRLGQRLTEWTGRRWVVSISSEAGLPTLEEQAQAAADAERVVALRHPLVQAALAAFPGSVIEAVRDLAPPTELDGAGEGAGELEQGIEDS